MYFSAREYTNFIHDLPNFCKLLLFHKMELFSPNQLRMTLTMMPCLCKFLFGLQVQFGSKYLQEIKGNHSGFVLHFLVKILIFRILSSVISLTHETQHHTLLMSSYLFKYVYNLSNNAVYYVCLKKKKMFLLSVKSVKPTLKMSSTF